MSKVFCDWSIIIIKIWTEIYLLQFLKQQIAGFVDLAYDDVWLR